MTLRQAIERYGLAVIVVVALAVVLIALPGNTNSSTVTGIGSGTNQGGSIAAGSSGSGTQPGGAGAVSTPGSATAPGSANNSVSGGGGAGSATDVGGGGGASPSSGAAASGSTSVVFGAGPHCRSDGRQVGVSYAMPPCAQWTGTNNGGATSRGVTKNQILVVRYLPQVNAGTRAILQGANLSDDPSVVARAYAALTRYGNLHYETYGRQVVMQDYNASGPPTSDEASRADAIDIAGRIKPFAVIEGDPAGPAPSAFIAEVARRGVVCFCSVSEPSSFYTAVPPIVFSPLPTIDEYITQTAEYICKHLAGKNAQFAGAGVQGQPRKFGLIYLAGQMGVIDPNAAQTKPLAEKAFAQCGIKFAAEVQYLYEPGQNQTDVTNIIAQMKANHVTTVVPFWDPLYPILITSESTRQAYFPEWFMTGTGLSDTTTAGRLYDQQQWTHAFGVSPLWVSWATVSKSAGYREYHWARPTDAPGSEGVLINVYRSRIAELFTTIHMAGPNLTAASATQGALNYPKTGGTPGRPLLFRTVQYPTAIKDFTETWYNAGAKGPDERGQQGSGMVTRADGGRRYQAGTWYSGPPHAFVAAGSVTVSDSPEGGGDWPTDVSPTAYPASKACLSC